MAKKGKDYQSGGNDVTDPKEAFETAAVQSYSRDKKDKEKKGLKGDKTCSHQGKTVEDKIK
jgi:hypothetical protein